VTVAMTVDQAFTYILSAGSAHQDVRAGPAPPEAAVLARGPDWRPEHSDASDESEAAVSQASGRSPAA
ncbi:MAG: hypothetical protein ACREM1_02615, partial [Longimicrobiales bacterium]